MEAKNAISDDMCRIYERRIAHHYYKIDYKFMEAKKKGIAPEVNDFPIRSILNMDEIIYVLGGGRIVSGAAR